MGVTPGAPPRLPDFVVIGAAKTGTTSLYHYLGQHPEIFMCSLKEVNYFAYEGEVGEQFPVTSWELYCALFDASAGARVVGESSPACLGCPAAAERIRARLPAAKLVASLRDPVERAFSGYSMRVRQGHERRPVEEAFGAGEVHVLGGFYYERLRRYFERFDREQIRVVLFEDLVSDARGACRELFGFLGVDPGFAPDTSVEHNPGGLPRWRRIHDWLDHSEPSRGLRRLAPPALRRWVRRLRDATLGPPPPVPPELRQWLVGLYREDTEKLEGLLGRDLSRWKRSVD